MLRLAAALAPLDVVRFNFPYRERGSARIDPMPVLKTCLVDLVSRIRKERRIETLIIGGRSMGGRVASMLAADGFECDGLLLAAYPLHPAGPVDKVRAKLRDAHLPQIRCPVLCLNGTRDALCRRDLMEKVLSTVRTSWTMHWLEGADHSFHVLKKSGRSDADVDREVAAAAGKWLSGL
jgi:uncharacterized protein